MHTFYSSTYRALIKNGIISIFPLTRKKIKEISFNGAKISTVEHTANAGSPILQELLSIMDTLPSFLAAFAGKNVFHVDYEMGTQRCKEYKTIEELREILIKYNFNSETIEEIIKLCMRKIYISLPKVN